MARTLEPGRKNSGGSAEDAELGAVLRLGANLLTFPARQEKQVRLPPDKDEAWRLRHDLVACPPWIVGPLKSGPNVEALEILNACFVRCLKHRATRTYEWESDKNQRFTNSLQSA